MPHYVTIRNKKTGRTMGINADIWALQKDRFKGKEQEFEEVYPEKVTILKRSVNTPEKKNQDVAGEK